MKVIAGRLGVLGVVVWGLFGLADATQNRPDERVAGTETIIAFTVSGSDYPRGEDAAAIALWTICSSTIGGDVSPVPAQQAGGEWEVSVTPAIGEHGEARLVGCLEDLTVDRVTGDVVSLRSSVP